MMVISQLKIVQSHLIIFKSQLIKVISKYMMIISQLIMGVSHFVMFIPQLMIVSSYIHGVSKKQVHKECRTFLIRSSIFKTFLYTDWEAFQ